MLREDLPILRASTFARLTREKPANPGQRGHPCPLAEPLVSLRLRTVLVPVDFSERSRKALSIAVSIARHSGASMILLHVKDTIIPPSRHESAAVRRLRTEIWLDGKRRLAAWANNLVKPSVAVRSLVSRGSPGAVIVDLAVKTHADLIVMASEGRTGLRRVLLRSVAEHVVRHADCPVLIVRDRKS